MKNRLLKPDNELETLDLKPETLNTNNLSAVKKILWQVLFLNLLVALLKIGVGLFSGILSITADGFHSLVDGASNVVGLIAMRIAQSPPDESHPYGHRKAETLATMFIGLMLLVAAYEILKTAIERLSGGAAPEVSTVSFAVMLFTISVNLGVTLYESRRGKALHSEILLADSQHTRSDLWVSVAVIAGLVGVRLGFPWLDAVVGVVIAGVIGLAAYEILSESANVLIDAASVPHDEIEALVRAMPEVRGVENVRSRGQADNSYVDLHVQVDPNMSTEAAHSVAHAVQRKITTSFPQVHDVMVHVEPVQSLHVDHPDIGRTLQGIAGSLGGAVHEVWAHSINGQYFVEAHFEVPPTLSLAEAHALADELEMRGKSALPGVAEITTHIEPMGEAVVGAQPQFYTEKEMLERVRATADGVCGAGASHHLRLWQEKDGWTVSMHIWLAGDMSIVEAHTISGQVEEALRREIPNLQRVVIHADPISSNQ